VSAEFRAFLARLAIDPEVYGRFLADPLAAAREAGLTEAQQALLASGDQSRLYVALTSDSADNGQPK
jgi:hypothetical protein